MENAIFFSEMKSSLRVSLYLALYLFILPYNVAIAQQHDTVCVGANYSDLYIEGGANYLYEPSCIIDSYSALGNTSDVPPGMYYASGNLYGIPTQVGTFNPCEEYQIYSSWCWNPSGTLDYDVYWNTWVYSPTIIHVVIDTFKRLSTSDTLLCEGQSTGLNLIACDANFSNAYTWQESTDGGVVWNTITGATGTSLSTGSLFETTMYRVLINNPMNGSGMSNTITIHVETMPTITISTIDSTICNGDTIKLVATHTGGTSATPN